MRDTKKRLRKWGWLFLIILMAVVVSIIYLVRKKIWEQEISQKAYEPPISVSGIGIEMGDAEETSGMEIGVGDAEETEKKGYDLPIDDDERMEAEADCKNVMELIADIYAYADKGVASNIVIPDETIIEMQEKLKEKGYSTITSIEYSAMENYQDVDDFLKACQKGISGSIAVYEIHFDGGIGRKKYMFDGSDMYVLAAKASWNANNQAVISFISYARIEEWEYSEKGWFAYEVCVPQPPQVTEVFNGNCMVRILPIEEECRSVSAAYLRPLSYQGNNLLCSDWDMEHLGDLDFNGMYEYLYAMKYQERFPYENYPDGIPKAEFEDIITEFLPVTPEQIQEYAVFHEDSQTYAWNRLGCGNYAPNAFGTAVPVACDIRQNEDGTITVTIDAVCELERNDSVMRHQLTVQILDDGSVRYLKNQILEDGLSNIPEYQYRVGRNGV